MKKGLIMALSCGVMISGMLNVFSAQANDQYNQGAGYAHEIQGEGTHTIKNFKPGDTLPNYTNNPAERNYYGGVTTPSTNLDGKGSQALINSESGKTITDSILNNPKEYISHDAPFIQAGKEIEGKADSIVGNHSGPECRAETVTRTEFTTHVCERDIQVLRTCDRAAEIGGYDDTRDENRKGHFGRKDINWWRDGAVIRGQFIAPFTGPIHWASLNSDMMDKTHYVGFAITVSLWGAQIKYGARDWGIRSINVSGLTVSQGQPVDIVISVDGGGGSNQTIIVDSILNLLKFGGRVEYVFDIDFSGSTKVQFWVPTTSVMPECALAKDAGAVRVNTVCSEPGGERWVNVNGQWHSVWTSCWRFTDTYRLQDTEEGSCSTYAKNPACTIAKKGCAFNDESGTCLRENVSYSCEHKTSGTGMMCGGQFFCADGRCAQTAAGTHTMFAHAVSQLAAVAAAGKDVAELNDRNVKAFTGRGQSCKKAAAGFNNCCKDSGWGADLGLSSCSSEEKALGQAKERKLTVDIGEYCSKKVLGICLEKKRGYCVFDSKLAQIIQHQGRQWQLGIGFGRAESPNCRGITVEELQRIKFDYLDFSNFKEDLERGTAVPGDNALLDRVKQQIEAKMNTNTGGK